MRLALAQLNPIVGDIAGNAAALRAAYARAREQGADLVAAGELALSGYPPEDLVLKPAFVAAGEAALEGLAQHTGAVPFVVGFVQRLADDGTASGARHPVANAAAVLRHGRVEAVYRKQRLPSYGVFDEGRYFRPGNETVVIDVGQTRVGLTICEDMWGAGGPVEAAATAGADVVLNVNASPYHRGKRAERERWATHHAAAAGVVVAYVNQAGGQDEVVFDGDSFVVAPDGRTGARGAQFATDLILVDVEGTRVAQASAGAAERLDPLAEVYAALVLGTRDYVRKNDFRRALIGISGGVDSALVATIAVDALGPDAVTGVALPSPFSSAGSLIDAKALAANLGIRCVELPIERAMRAFDTILAGEFAGATPGVAEENIQSRIRGTLLMALSNRFGDIVLATGNKSEYAVGYSTLYGDMAGGFAVIKDVPKTLVFELARHRNAVAGREVIPQATIDKPPSAELRPDQRDTDSLPPYAELDPILESYVEQFRSVAEIARAGHDHDLVAEVARLVDRAEYKRRQAAPGIKITARAFGKDRRLPITQRWTG
jgi:NAD+ synthase (glutamine-hydrolysing)